MIPFLHIGPLTLPTFGLMVATAMICGYFVLRADLRRRGINAEAETLVAVPSIAGMIGAKLYHVFESPREFFADPLGQLFTSYGFAWFGGLLAGIAAFVYLGKKYRIPILLLFDIASPACALGYGVGRIGCLLSGDGDYGIPTSLPWGMSFPNGLVPTTARVHPTPIYEFLAALVITWFLWRLGRVRHGTAAREQAATGRAVSTARVSGKTGAQQAARLQQNPAFRTPGTIFAAYLITTGVARFLVEFIRINPRSFFGMTNAQTASLASIALGVFLLWHLRAKKQPAAPAKS
ncbi:MAG: prolipoprotein diacylglyceryl transferase [Candidatus Acidiferrales bacterium]